MVRDQLTLSHILAEGRSARPLRNVKAGTSRKVDDDDRQLNELNIGTWDQLLGDRSLVSFGQMYSQAIEDRSPGVLLFTVWGQKNRRAYFNDTP